MKVYIIRDYRRIIEPLKGRELTEFLIGLCYRKYVGQEEVPPIYRSPKGKPHFEEGKGYPCFSVSHSGEIFACVFSEENIGIDVQIHDGRNKERIAERFFSRDEYEKVKDKRDSFYRIWTRKEALAKYTGEGIGKVIDRSNTEDAHGIYFMDIDIDEEYTGALCTGKEEADYEIQFLDGK